MRNIKKIIIAVAAGIILTAVFAVTASATSVRVATTTSNLRHRAAPNTNARVISTMPNNSLTVLVYNSGQTPNNWARVQHRGTVGYAHTDWLRVHNEKNVNLGRGVVTGSSVNLRSQPNTSSASQGMIARNTNVDVTGVRGGWYRVRHNNRNGYMHPRYIRLVNVPTAVTDGGNNSTVQNRGVITTNNVNFRAQASLNASVFQMLARGTVVEVRGRQGDWVNVTFNGRTGFVFHRYIRLTDAANVDAVRDEILGTVPGTGMGQQVVNFARQFIGFPYRWGGQSPSTGFDCSGLVWYVHRHFGRTLNRTATGMLSNGTPIARANMRPGDLVFFRAPHVQTGANHVGIYVGGGNFIHSPQSGQTVTISTLLTGNRNRDFLTARRIFN